MTCNQFVKPMLLMGVVIGLVWVWPHQEAHYFAFMTDQSHYQVIKVAGNDLDICFLDASGGDAVKSCMRAYETAAETRNNRKASEPTEMTESYKKRLKEELEAMPHNK